MIRRAFTVLFLLAAEVGGVALVLRVPSHSLDQIRHLPPEDAVVAVLRFVALAIACWLTASTSLYTIASVTRIPTFVRGVRWITLPGLRQLVDGLVATTLVATSALAVPTAAGAATSPLQAAEPMRSTPPAPLYTPRPAGDGVAAPSPPSTTTADHAYRPHPAGDAAGDPAPAPVPLAPSPAVLPTRPSSAIPATPPARPSPATPPARPSPATPPTRPSQPTPPTPPTPPSPPIPPSPPTPATPATRPAPQTSATPATPASLTYVLRAGDHLWSVAASRVAKQTGNRLNELTARDIGRYWMRLVDINTPHLRSGDPNVVHPGETLLLPDPAQG